MLISPDRAVCRIGRPGGRHGGSTEASTWKTACIGRCSPRWPQSQGAAATRGFHRRHDPPWTEDEIPLSRSHAALALTAAVGAAQLCTPAPPRACSPRTRRCSASATACPRARLARVADRGGPLAIYAGAGVNRGPICRWPDRPFRNPVRSGNAAGDPDAGRNHRRAHDHRHDANRAVSRRPCRSSRRRHERGDTERR